MENPLNTPPDNMKPEPVKKDRSLLYMGIILGVVVLILGYLTFFVEDVSHIFSKKKEVVPTVVKHKSDLLEKSKNMSDEEVKRSLIKFIEAFYYDQQKGYFDPPSYFADITQTYYNYHNLTYERLKELHSMRLKDMHNLSQNWIVSSLDYKREDSGLQATYWTRISYFRPSRNKQESADVKMEMLIDGNGKITSLREMEIKNQTSFDVVAEPDTSEAPETVHPNLEPAVNPPTAAVPEARYEGKLFDLGSVDTAPEFTGGQAALGKFVAQNLKYPIAARENNVQGRVYISFVVEKNGSLSDLKVIKGIGSGCDDEALRVIKNSPAWKPGLVDGKPVRTAYVLPISFKLAN